MNNIKLIDEGYKGVAWNPPSFTLNGKEIPDDDYVEIHDDIFTRFLDYYNWIETYNPGGPKEFNRGFNYYGITAISGENHAKFGKLIDLLYKLYGNAPENIILTGNFCFTPDDEVSSGYSPQSGYYQQVKISKVELLEISHPHYKGFIGSTTIFSSGSSAYCSSPDYSLRNPLPFLVPVVLSVHTYP